MEVAASCSPIFFFCCPTYFSHFYGPACCLVHIQIQLTGRGTCYRVHIYPSISISTSECVDASYGIFIPFFWFDCLAGNLFIFNLWIYATFSAGEDATMPGEIHFGAVASMGQEAGYVRSALGENVSGIRGSGANLMGLLRAKRVDILIRGFRRDSKEQIVEKYI